MFKPLIASIILLAFVIQTFSGQVIQLNYYLNTGAFAKNCENKMKPKMHCNGKCQMMKKMQEEEKKDQQVPERKSTNKNVVLSSGSFFCSIAAHLMIIQNIFPLKVFPAPIHRSFSVFHPPQCC
jgi:hypothetical protein